MAFIMILITFKVMLMMEKEEHNFGDIIKSVTPFLKQNGKGDEINQIAKSYEMSINSPTSILICGEFKRGKSTFVNALLGRNLCATDTDICTAVVSVIKYGEKEKATRYYGDFANVKSQVFPLDQLEKYTVGTAEEIDNTLYVEMELPIPVLKDGWVIIDTPGVGGLDPRHATLTNYFLPRADVTLFMTDVNEPLTTTELDFFKNKVLPYSKEFAVVVNKADLKDKATVEEFRQDTINKISTSCQLSQGDVMAIAVSSAAEAYPESDLGESNFTELRTAINNLVNKYRLTIKQAIRDNFVELLNLVIAPLQAQLQQIEQPNVDQIGELNKQKAEIDKKIVALTDPSSSFRISINKIITERREEIQNELNEASVILQSEIFPSLLRNPNAKNEKGGEWIGNKLNDSIAEIASNLTLELNRSFEEISALPEFEGMLQYEAKDYNGKIIVRDVDNTVPMNKRITPLMSGVGIITIGLAYIATGFMGYLATIALGSYVAWKNQNDASTIYKESNLRQVYFPQLSGAITGLNTYVNSRFQEFQQEWLFVVTKRAKAYKESLQESIQKIQQVKQSINQAVSMRVHLQNKLKPLISARDNAKEVLF